MLPLGQPQWLALNEWGKHPPNESGAETNMGDGDNRWWRWLRGGDPLEQGLPAKNDNAINLINRAAQFAGKPRSHIEVRCCKLRTVLLMGQTIAKMQTNR